MSTLNISWNANSIKCYLPITLPTSKTRVKRNGNPVATRKTSLRKGDTIEWQISYLKEHKELSELGDITKLAYENGIISGYQLKCFLNELRDYKEFFDEKYGIKKILTDELFYDFKVLSEKTPILNKYLGDGYYVSVVLRYKQRAVGYQSMIYIYIPIEEVISEDGTSLIGRTARVKEIVVWNPSKEIIFATLKAFAVASKKHNDDIQKVISIILNP